ncbi:MAG TPA: SCO family protein [Reyranella sp.]|nr:SCO family protein [Reyranella sp.]
MRAVLALLLIVLAVPAHAFDPFTKAGIDRRPNARVPLDVRFRDEHGRTLTLRAATEGRPILLVPVVHRCPNICGLTLAGIGEAVQLQKFVAGRDFTLIAFGIDPREGPADAKQSIDGLSQNFPALQVGVHGLTGDAASIAAVVKPLGYRYAWDDDLNQYAHIAAVAVLTPDGRLSRWLYGITPDPTDVRLALTEAGEGKVGGWGDQLLLLCYHYNPQTGRYGPLIWTLLRVAGGATALLGLAWIGLALRRERRAAR